MKYVVSAISPEISEVKFEPPVESNKIESSIVGLGDVFQQTPIDNNVLPPLFETVPPEEALLFVIDVIDVIDVVVMLGNSISS
jgi:hypothetical protein